MPDSGDEAAAAEDSEVAQIEFSRVKAGAAFADVIQLAESIRASYSAAKNSKSALEKKLLTTINRYREVGRKLIELRIGIKHGEWQPLFQSASNRNSYFDFTSESARRYSELGKKYPDEISDLPDDVSSLGDMFRAIGVLPVRKKSKENTSFTPESCVKGATKLRESLTRIIDDDWDKENVTKLREELNTITAITQRLG